MPTGAALNEASRHSYNGELGPRVAALEVGVRNAATELDHVKVSLDRLASSVSAGFAEIRRDSANAGRTNWGWVIASISVFVAIVGAVGTAWVRPLQQIDENYAQRIGGLEERQRENRESLVRIDERLKIYREFGFVQTRN